VWQKFALIAGGIFSVSLFYYLNRISTKGFFNDSYDEAFASSALLFGVDPKFLKAIAMTESGTRFEFLGINEPIGDTSNLMHVTVPTARDYEPNITKEDLENPRTSIRVASKLIANLKNIFDGDIEKMAMAYNQGARATQLGKTYSINNGYLARFLRNYDRVG
jgi:soluble lytic murein transglycosylase-like protein